MKVLSKIIMKMLGGLEGVCAKCGSTNIGFVDEDGASVFKCLDCGSDEIKNIRFKHFKKNFYVGYAKGVRIELDKNKK